MARLIDSGPGCPTPTPLRASDMIEAKGLANDEAVKVANETEYGLAASVFSAGGRNAMRRGLTRARQRQNNRFQSQGSAPFVNRIIEKYGAVSGASASGSTTSSGNVARST